MTTLLSLMVSDKVNNTYGQLGFGEPMVGIVACPGNIEHCGQLTNGKRIFVQKTEKVR